MNPRPAASPDVNQDNPDKPDSESDVALIHGRTADGQGLRILRQREHRLELGEVRPLKEGHPIHGEVVTLRPRPSFPWLCDVTVELPARAPGGDVVRRERKSGPAQVATDSYRQNWDVVFSRSRTALN